MGLEDKELKEFESEKISLDLKNRVYQNSIAEELMNGGLGNDIMFRLNNPIKISKYKQFKLNTKFLFKKLFEIL
jgi:hypothetical protein